MRSILNWIMEFNQRLHLVVSRDTFTSLGMLSLTVASWVTTLMGMLKYTDSWIIALLGSLGFQLLMLYSAVRYSTVPDKFNFKAYFLLLLFFTAGSVSSFFSFASFHQVMEPPSRRLEEADTLLRNEWTNVYTTTKSQILGEFRRRLNAGDGQQNGRYQTWVRALNDMKATAERYHSVISTTIHSRQTDINGQQITSGALDQRAQLSEKIEKKKNEVAAKEKLDSEILSIERDKNIIETRIQTELSGGGSIRPDGTVSGKGEGPITRGLRQQLAIKNADLQIKLSEQESQADRIRRIDNEIREIQNKILSSTQRNFDDQLSKLQIAAKELATFDESVQAIHIVPPTVAAESPEAFLTIKSDIDRGVKSCQAVKARYKALSQTLNDAAITPPEVPNGHAPGSGSTIAGNSCDTPPFYSADEDISAHISRISGFLNGCSPNSIPPREALSAGPTNATRQNNQQSDVYALYSYLQSYLVEAGRNSADPEYTATYRKLQRWFQACLATAPELENTDALRKSRSEFADLMLKYNPQAHLFTRSISAFKRGDPTAWFAATVAVLIDLLIFFAGLAMQRDGAAPNDVPILQSADAARDDEILHFIQDNPGDVVGKICTAIPYAVKQVEDIDGIQRSAYILPIESATFTVLHPELEMMNNLGLLTLSDNTIKVTSDQAEFLFDSVGLKYNG